MNLRVFIFAFLLYISNGDVFVHHFSGGTCSGAPMTKRENYEHIGIAHLSEANCRARCVADAECDFYQTFNQNAYSSGWPRHCMLYKNAYCDVSKVTTNHAWFETYVKASAIPPVVAVTTGPPMTASCSSVPLDYCLRTTWEGGDSPYAPTHNTVWRLADVLNGEPVFVKDGDETGNNGALGYYPNFNQGSSLANYCAGQTWDAVVLDKFPDYSFIVGGTWNWGVAGSCTGTESADILEVLRGQRETITTAFRARTNSYGPAHRDVKVEVIRDVLECGGRFYSDALFSKTETEQCAIMEAVLPKNPTATPTSNPTKEPSMNPTLNPTANPSSSPTKEPSVSPTLNPTASPSPFPTAAEFIIKIKSFHGKPSDIIDSKKVEGQPNVDIDMYNFEEKLTPFEGRRFLRSNEEKSN